jgi:hypothetical protein
VVRITGVKRLPKVLLPVAVGFGLSVVGFVGYTQIASSQTSKSPDPRTWVNSSGQEVPSRVPDRLQIALTPSGTGWIDSSVLLGVPGSATARQDGPFLVYSDQIGKTVVGWFYRSAFTVPVGTSPEQARTYAAARRGPTTGPTTTTTTLNPTSPRTIP